MSTRRIMRSSMLEDGIADVRAVPMEVSLGMGARRFVDHALGKAIYSTAWDGTVVVSVLSDGSATVWTER